MKNIIKYFAMIFAGLLLSVSCNGKSGESNAKSQTSGENNEQEKGQNDMNTNDKNTSDKNEKVLIVFFSHAGENYGVGNIKVGNTKLVADEIQKLTGGDEFEVVAEKSYDMPYDALTKLAKEEAERGEKPAFKGEVENIDQYSTIFIGGPIWWGTYPQVMFTFFDRYDFNSKTIIPFSTHEGSGLGSVVSDLKKLYPKANFKPAFSIYGHECQKDLGKVDKWLKVLGY